MKTLTLEDALARWERETLRPAVQRTPERPRLETSWGAPVPRLGTPADLPGFDPLRELAETADPPAFRAERVAEFRERFANPYVAAERGYVDDVIEPRETRRRLISALETLRTKRDQNPPRKHGNLPL